MSYFLHLPGFIVVAASLLLATASCSKKEDTPPATPTTDSVAGTSSPANALTTMPATVARTNNLPPKVVMPDNRTINLVATINGAQQVPANPSAATGSFTGVYNTSNRQLTYTVSYQGVTPTTAHIHTGTPSTNGPVAIPFASLNSPITGSATLTPEQGNNLLNNRMYVNIHSINSAHGEIRGDIRRQ